MRPPTTRTRRTTVVQAGEGSRVEREDDRRKMEEILDRIPLMSLLVKGIVVEAVG